MNDVDADEHRQMMAPEDRPPRQDRPRVWSWPLPGHRPPRSGVHDGQGPAPAGQLAGIRCLKRYIAREVYTAIQTDLNPTTTP